MRNKKVLFSVFIIITVFFNLFINSLASNNVSVVSVNSVAANIGESVTVPITISNNTGICGATITVNYNSNLVLTAIDKGEGLSNLTFTKPGRLTANPVNLVWDGMEADYTNGVIAYLTFIAPQNPGQYDIHISYEDGDFVDGNLSPSTVIMNDGYITVQESGNGNPVYDGIIISVDSVTTAPSATFDVPIKITGNTGICGATISLTYDSNLTPISITKGDAFPSLTFTKPGRLSNNPLNLVWDGMEEDESNGTVAIITFRAPVSIGTYSVSLSYDEGDVLDGDLNVVNLTLVNGTVNVAKAVTVNIAGNKTVLENKTDKNGKILIGFYNGDKLLQAYLYDDSCTTINLDKYENSTYAKIMCWNENLMPLCEAKTVVLK